MEVAILDELYLGGRFMDIGAMSISMNQGALKTAVQISVLKLGMNSEKQVADQMTEMINNIAVEPGKGINLDKIV
ncbi:YjfB family protein [Clostridium butyricum]|uniref:YjfB family protein n=2 Tax=Clostridium butyricum TaxID=1492 RepID=UPI00374EAC30